MDTIDISSMDRAEVLARLYNRARPQGMGFLHYEPGDMSLTEAREILAQRGSDPCFDYLRGRVMKVNLGEPALSAWLYDRDNGHGAAADALTSPRYAPRSES